MPRYFIEQFSDPGDTVVDPFSGRGTAALEACIAGRVGIGVDLNPLAALLTDVKVDPPAQDDCLRRIHELERSYVPAPVGDRAPPEIQMLFESTVTLPQLLHLKSTLDLTDRTDRFLLGTLAGILHGHHARDAANSRCLSVSMPNTFSMSPGYLARYIAEKGLVRPPFDVFAKLRSRVLFEHSEGTPPRRGRGHHGDARDLTRMVAPGSARLVVTSPPYLNVVRYGKFNWIRLWLLGESVSDVDLSLRVEKTDRRLALSDRLGVRAYRVFLRDILLECARVLTDDGTCVMTIGDVTNAEHGHQTLATETWEAVQDEIPLKLAAVIVDDVNEVGKVSKIWGDEHKGRATRTERVLVLSKTGVVHPRFADPRVLIAQVAAGGKSKVLPANRPGVVRVAPVRRSTVQRVDADPKAAAG